MSLTVLILTRDEEIHIARALSSVESIADRCVIVDSGSNDRTVELARAAGAIVLENPWVNYATQLNWGLANLPEDTEWVMRLDADEYVTDALAEEIGAKLSTLEPSIDGVYVSRRMHFLGQPIRWGGVFPVRVLRLFRYRRGHCEQRWMDEHILVSGPTVDFEGYIIDDNRNSLTWWTTKHNSYASREAIDLLNLEYNFINQETIADLSNGKQAGVKRWIKEVVYARLPVGTRAFSYFLYRYIFRLGFLDGREGRAFHVLQGFWYRFLVDAKLLELKREIHSCGSTPEQAIEKVLGFTIESNSSADFSKTEKRDSE